MLLLLSLLPHALAEEAWYYPDDTDRRAPVSGNWQVGDALVMELADGIDPRTHPDVLEVEWLPPSSSLVRVRLRPGADALALSREFHELPQVRWAHPDFVLDVTPTALPNDPLVSHQWHLENTGQIGNEGVDINAEAAWAITAGAGQLISIIDTGVDLTHPDLLGFSGPDFVDGDEDNYPSSENGHGTACAGLAAAIGNNDEGGAGVAYEAEIYGVRLLGGETTMSDTYASITRSVDAGASVLSNSWGFSGSCEGFSLPMMYKKALDYAEEEGRQGLGSVVLHAAGNDNCDISNNGLLAYPTVVAVAAHSADDDKESYSSFGLPIDITAPSGGLVTTDIAGDPGYGSYEESVDYTGGMSGTSAATPVAAGVFALMFAANERLTAAQARDVVCQTATRNDVLNGEFDDNGWSPFHGCGRIDAGAAVQAVANAAPRAPENAMEVSRVYEDRIWLDWHEAVDADGDPLRYRVALQTQPGTWIELETGQRSLEITDYAETGDLVLWKVQALDRWGPGPWSDEVPLLVLSRPEPPEVAPETSSPQTCSSTPGGPWWMAFFLFSKRRRTRMET